MILCDDKSWYKFMTTPIDGGKNLDYHQTA